MSKSKIEKYIPQAMKILDKIFSDGVIPPAYNGYISSFGASIMQSGLLPTLALFEKTTQSKEKDKSYLTKIILKILDENTNEVSLLKYVLNNNEEILKPKIIDISIALKLSIRTFKLEEVE